MINNFLDYTEFTYYIYYIMPSSEKILEDRFLYYTVTSSEQHGAFFETTHLAFLIGKFENEILRNHHIFIFYYTVYLSIPSCEEILEQCALFCILKTITLAFLDRKFENEIFRNYGFILYTVYLSVPSCEQILEYRVLFRILTSTELQGEFLKTTNLAFPEIKKSKKKILRNHLHFVQVHLLRQPPLQQQHQRLGPAG